MRKAAEIASAFSPKESLDAHRRFFLVGIGGAGMSALARMLKHRGYEVRGTDSTLSPAVERLRDEGFEVIVGHTGDPLRKDDALVLTDAIDLDASPEVARARELGLPMVRRSQALGWLLRPYKVIAVTGTHGKTTTTGMTGAGLIAAGFDPTVVVGASIPDWGGPVREGGSEWAVVEACEAYDSFHDLDPYAVILTNLELDHVDFHGSYENLERSVERFTSRVAGQGPLVFCAEDEGSRTVGERHPGVAEGYTIEAFPEVPLRCPGDHNRRNASGALTLARLVGADPSLAAPGIAAFSGAERRLQRIYSGDVTVFDDYAHTPAEIAASLQGLRSSTGAPPVPPSDTVVPPVGRKDVLSLPSGTPDRGRDALETHGRDARVTFGGGKGDIVRRRGAYLPHWEKAEGTYHVVFRLADSLPSEVREVLKAEREDLASREAAHQVTPKEASQLKLLLRESVERYLDAGSGQCLFRDPDHARTVTEALSHFDGERYHLHAYCVMPNHIHVVFELAPGESLPKVVHSWKSFTAHRLPKVADNAVWGVEYYDHLIRDEVDLERTIEYVRQNPSKARLKDWPHLYLAAPPGDTGVPPVPPSDTGVPPVGRKDVSSLPSGTPDRGRDALETHGRDARVTGGRLIVAYQPHLYSRTDGQYEAFARALEGADLVFLTDIYPAREAPVPGVSSARIAELVKVPCRYVPSRHLLPREVAQLARPGDVVVGMGAGTIESFAPAFVQEWERRRRVQGDWSPSVPAEDRPKLDVAVLAGGDSSEREVSLHSGRAIHAALQKLGHRSRIIDVTELLLREGTVKPFVGAARPDVAFLAVHGTHAEDGAIQGLLELLAIPYTGAGIQASAIAMDKAMTKRVLEAAGLPVPRGVLVTSPADPGVPTPLIVKPNAQGSTVGLSFVEDPADVERAIEHALRYDSAAIVEEWVRGMEISVPVLDDEALPPVEIAPVHGHYDFGNKYTPGATEEIVPARLPSEVLAEAQRIALAAHRALGARGATRTDMIVRDGRPVVLEVNTLPGMTQTSLLPNSAAAAGISFPRLVDLILAEAMRRHAG